MGDPTEEKKEDPPIQNRHLGRSTPSALQRANWLCGRALALLTAGVAGSAIWQVAHLGHNAADDIKPVGTEPPLRNTPKLSLNMLEAFTPVVGADEEFKGRRVMEADGDDWHANHSKMHQNASNFRNLLPAQSADDFRRLSRRKDFFKMLLYNKKNHLSFENPAGPLNTGLCWWHSYFQRNATFMNYYSPKKPKPTPEQALVIIRRIRDLEGPVEIPGYENLWDFSTDFRAQIESELGIWQRNDTLALWGPLRGATAGGPYHAIQNPFGAESLAATMAFAYAESKKGHIPFQIQQKEGLAAHAWLIVDMEKMNEESDPPSYFLHVIDSNEPHVVREYTYLWGQKEFRTKYVEGKYDDRSAWFTPVSYQNENQNKIAEKIETFSKDKK